MVLLRFLVFLKVMGATLILHPQAPMEFAETLDFNMHYYMSVAGARQDEFGTDRTVPLHVFSLNELETCYAVFQLKDRLEFLFTCAKNREKPEPTRLVILDFSEEEIPPSETFVVHLTAMRVLRDSTVVPRLLDIKLDDERLLVYEYFGGRNLASLKRRLTLKEVALIGARMVEIVKTVHDYGIVHGEVWNLKSWVFESTIDSLRLTNFKKGGLFVDPVTMEHVQDEEAYDEEFSVPQHLEGTDDGEFSVKIAKKSSRFRTNSKRRSIFAGGVTTKSVSRRDDLATIAELLINWIVGDIDLFADEYVARNASRESIRKAKKNRAKNLDKMYPGKIPRVFLEFYQYCLDLEFGQETVQYMEWAAQLRALGGSVKQRYVLTGSVSAMAAQRSVLKDVDFEHARMFVSLKAQTGNAGAAARTVLSLVPDIVSNEEGVCLRRLLTNPTMRGKIILNFSKILSRFIVLLRHVHESGLVHGNVSPEAFVWIGTDDDISKNWRISFLDSSSSFIAEDSHIHETMIDLPRTIPLESLTVYQLASYPKAPPLTRRDDAFRLMEMAMDILFPRSVDKFSVDSVLAFKRNRHWNVEDRAGIVSRMYYRSMHYGFSDPPNYESALGELMRRIL